jgi:hypothetical protein
MGYQGKEILLPDSLNSTRIEFLIQYLMGIKGDSNNHSLNATLLDILYGVGLCISTEHFKNVDGFVLWEEVLAMIVRDQRYLANYSAGFSALTEEAKASLLLRKTFEG